MAETPSTMLALGSSCRPSRVRIWTGTSSPTRTSRTPRTWSWPFLCPHCPYVKHVRRTFAELATACQARDVAVVAINLNDPAAYPEDDSGGHAGRGRVGGLHLPLELIDERQDVAKAFRAACTPDFYVFDRHRRLAYRGQFDASRPKSQTPVTGADLRGALDALLGGTSVASTQRPGVGCSIKWKPGNAPPVGVGVSSPP